MCLGIPGKVVRITSESTAQIDVNGVQRSADITCVLGSGTPPDTLIGQWVLVHVGFAMSIIDPDEARQTLELLEQIGELAEDVDAYNEGERANVE